MSERGELNSLLDALEKNTNRRLLAPGAKFERSKLKLVLERMFNEKEKIPSKKVKENVVLKSEKKMGSIEPEDIDRLSEKNQKRIEMLRRREQRLTKGLEELKKADDPEETIRLLFNP